MSFPPTSNAAHPSIETTPPTSPATSTSAQQQSIIRGPPRYQKRKASIPQNGKRVRTHQTAYRAEYENTKLTLVPQLERHNRPGGNSRHVRSGMVLFAQGREPSVCFPHPTGARNCDGFKLTRLQPSLWRSSIILSIVSCYLMWAITFLAQLHPLIEPRRSDLRKEFIHH
jgi:hypothetical protein